MKIARCGIWSLREISYRTLLSFLGIDIHKLEVYTYGNSTTKGSEMFYSIDTYDLRMCGWFVAMSVSVVVAVAYLSSVASSSVPTLAAVVGMCAVTCALISLFKMRYIQKLQSEERAFAESVILSLEQLGD